jgi:pimeloyl-ACP methyl ester carboxylesterase
MPASRFAIDAGSVQLEGDLQLPPHAAGVVVFSHGSGSGRHSPRNQFVAAELRRAGIGTLLFDLLTAEEDRDYDLRFDILLLTERLGHAVRSVRDAPEARGLPVGLFGASTGAASALRVAAEMPDAVAAVVSRGGRPDLAGDGALRAVRAPALLIVGSEDREVIRLNRAAAAHLAHCTHELALVPGATHLFEEPGTLEEAARLASAWFTKHLAKPRPRKPSRGARAAR